MYTKQEAIEAINRGEKFQDKKFNQVRDDLDVALALVESRTKPFLGTRLWIIEARMKTIEELLQGKPKQLAQENPDAADLITALQDNIKVRDLEASFQKSLNQKSAPRRTTKI